MEKPVLGINLHDKENIVLIDAGKDTKVSASKA